jgi:preprotein translocase subunit SecD
MATRRLRFAVLYVPALALALVVLYLALPDVQPSTAKGISSRGIEGMPAMMRFEAAEAASPAEMAAARDVLKERLSSYVQDDTQLSLAVEGDQLAVFAPASLASSVLSSQGLQEIVAETSRIGRVELVDGGTEFLTIESVVKTGPQPIPDRGVYQAVLTSTDFEAAEARLDDRPGSLPVIDFRLTPAGDARLAAHTSDLRGYYLCLVVDARVRQCPVLRTPLRGRQGTMELRNGAGLDDARALAAMLRSGPLPVSFQPVGSW